MTGQLIPCAWKPWTGSQDDSWLFLGSGLFFNKPEESEIPDCHIYALWFGEQKKRVFSRSTFVSLVFDLAALCSSFKQNVRSATFLFNYEAIFIIT